ncbi:hypothetical protein [Flavobacterium sp. SORGH_AS_0622]|uniref:hypothetical protein n=1 Tax=Flavobacterium sp. SORGH_AS_0622 TaxID=3041772 RepID=UPI002783D32C|nr:hypothetical protein [Flavobacterium sp. SORGH_AS_0622]MDQ1165879.1 hypothetical protein [Flavobacterium sp. SORGH_AS_0622]
MSEVVKKQIRDFNEKIVIWKKFADAVLELNDEDLKTEGDEGRQMYWTTTGIDYYKDESIKAGENIFTTKKNGVIKMAEFVVPNEYLKGGILACFKSINREITHLENTINSLTLKLKKVNNR